MIVHILQHYIVMNIEKKRRAIAEEYILNKYGLGKKVSRKISRKHIYAAYMKLIANVELSTELKSSAYRDFVKQGFINKSLKKLQSKSVYQRLKAITFLSSFPEVYILNTLRGLLETEHNERVKVLLLYSLKNNINDAVFKSIIYSIIGSKRFYQYRVINFLQDYLPTSIPNIEIYFDRNEFEVKEVFVDLAKVMYHPDFEKLLLKHLADEESVLLNHSMSIYQGISRFRIERMYQSTLSSLSNFYNYDLITSKYLLSDDPKVVSVALSSINVNETPNVLDLMISFGSQSKHKKVYANAMLNILDKNRKLYDDLFKVILKRENKDYEDILAHVFSNRIEYLIVKYYLTDVESLEKMIDILCRYNFTTEIINFLNTNKNLAVEKMIFKVLLPYATREETLLIELNQFLDPLCYDRTGFRRLKISKDNKRTVIPEISKTKWLIKNIIFSILFIPFLYLLFNLKGLITGNTSLSLPGYIVFLNVSFILYYLSVNFIYLFLAVLSFYKNKNQMKLWDIKRKTLLYEFGMIPGVSIIAPAYNEELSIVDNIHSLLNLDYPNYEVIVVNDGSKDRTLEKVIKHFNLVRKDVFIDHKIQTKDVIAVYKSPAIPNLTVVDKQNGGKADALNVGINYAIKEYICGIDADSILEGDALLKLMSSMLDHEKITIALGGSIIPVNSSLVDHGYIEKYNIPIQTLAALQNIEYLRAFNISRMGFSEIKSLLIISGAFGIFEKRILIESGGYLTVSSMKKDTVGEDMELVVRVTRKAIEQGLNYRVDFIAKARCYTEVPQELKSFLKQRKRWQRGLIDILSYHRKMIMNPKYKQVGMVAMPYFYIFEAIGPLFEVQAYLAIFAGLIFGLLNTAILIALLVVTILLGVTLSLFSLLISETDQENYTLKEIIRLLGYAVIENFGWRQFNSLYRVVGFFASLKENQAWGQMNRIGFATQAATTKK